MSFCDSLSDKPSKQIRFKLFTLYDGQEHTTAKREKEKYKKSANNGSKI